MSNFGKRKRRRKKRDEYRVYSDGSANGKSDGGFVAIIYNGDEFIGYSGGHEAGAVTNNQAELKAIHLGVKFLLGVKNCRVDFMSDSKWALGAIFKDWKIKKNVELVEAIRRDIETLKSQDVIVRYKHVPREEKHIQICDKYANKYRKEGGNDVVRI